MQKERNDGERKTKKIRMKLKKKRIDKEKLKNGQNQQIKKRRPKRKEQRIRQEVRCKQIISKSTWYQTERSKMQTKRQGHTKKKVEN